MNKTAIEWTELTWNMLRAKNRETGHVGHYCERISPACANCYAAEWNVRQRHRRHDGTPSTCGTGVDFIAKNFDAVDLFLDEDELTAPLRLKRPSLIFPCDMTDLFLDRYHFAWIRRVFDVMRQAHWHTFQVLTKRPQRMAELAPKLDWPANVWAGTTVEDQPRAEERIEWLLQVPAPVRFLSIEPLLGPLRLTSKVTIPASGDHPQMYGFMVGRDDGRSILSKTPEEALKKSGIGWVIVGGESGPGARPMHPDWVRSLRDQCLAAGVPFFFKQWGEYCPVQDWVSREKLGNKFLWRALLHNGTETKGEPDHVWNYRDVEPERQSEYAAYRVGKKAAGRLLDGVVWDQFPSVAK